VPLEPLAADVPWRPDFDVALDHARHWRLAKALTRFRSLSGVAGESREVFTNIGVLCEMLATYDDPDNAAARGAGYLHGWITAGLLTAASIRE
jgi:hypothetical protein